MPTFNEDPDLPSIDEVAQNGGRAKATIAREKLVIKSFECFITDTLKKVGFLKKFLDLSSS